MIDFQDVETAIVLQLQLVLVVTRAKRLFKLIKINGGSMKNKLSINVLVCFIFLISLEISIKISIKYSKLFTTIPSSAFF